MTPYHYFTDADRTLIREHVALRQSVHAGDPLTQVDLSRSPERLDIEGCAGEVLFMRLIPGCPPLDNRRGPDPGYDFIWRGWRVDVKTTPASDGHLIHPDGREGLEKADVFALVRLNPGAEAALIWGVFAGWISRQGWGRCPDAEKKRRGLWLANSELRDPSLLLRLKQRE